MAASDIFENRSSRAFVRTVVSTTINLADLQLANETVTGFTIAKLYWTTPASTSITLVRNSITIASLNGSSAWPLDEVGITLSDQPTWPLVLTLPAGATVILELNKIKA
jgi:hypothetical protein